MLWLIVGLAVGYAVMGVAVGLISQAMNPTGKIYWSEALGIATAVFVLMSIVTVIIAAIIGGIMALMR